MDHVKLIEIFRSSGSIISVGVLTNAHNSVSTKPFHVLCEYLHMSTHTQKPRHIGTCTDFQIKHDTA